jgi:hypothetical protein
MAENSLIKGNKIGASTAIAELLLDFKLIWTGLYNFACPFFIYNVPKEGTQ